MNLLLMSYSGGQAVNYPFLSGTLPAGLVFDRASSGARTTAAGLIQMESAGSPRFDYDPANLQPRGLLIEPQRTNKIVRTTPGPAYWTAMNCATEPNSTMAPDGMLSAARLVDGTASAAKHYLTAAPNHAYTAGEVCVFSVFAKEAERSLVQLTNNAAVFTDNTHANFDLANAAVTHQSSDVLAAGIDPAGNGWYRCFMACIAANTASGSGMILAMITDPQADKLQSFTGENKGVYVWGAQSEVTGGALAPSSLMPNEGTTTVTRAADQLSFAIPNGVTRLRFIFGDGSNQDVAVTAGAYTVPTTLNKTQIKRITTP